MGLISGLTLISNQGKKYKLGDACSNISVVIAVSVTSVRERRLVSSFTLNWMIVLSFLPLGVVPPERGRAPPYGSSGPFNSFQHRMLLVVLGGVVASIVSPWLIIVLHFGVLSLLEGPSGAPLVFVF